MSANDELATNWENILEITVQWNQYKLVLPWGGEGDANIPIEIVEDIKKEDGLKMIFHNLYEGSNNGHYIVLHNKNRDFKGFWLFK